MYLKGRFGVPTLRPGQQEGINTPFFLLQWVPTVLVLECTRRTPASRTRGCLLRLFLCQPLQACRRARYSNIGMPQCDELTAKLSIAVRDMEGARSDADLSRREVRDTLTLRTCDSPAAHHCRRWRPMQSPRKRWSSPRRLTLRKRS